MSPVPKCTAPSRGHTSAAARAKCPRCGSAPAQWNVPAAPPKLSAPARDWTAAEMLAAASDPSTDADVLRTISRFSGDAHVSETVALNPNLPPDEIDRLLGEGGVCADNMCAKNPGVTPEALLRAHREGTVNRRMAAAESPNASAEHLALAAQDPSIGVQLSAAANPNTPAASLVALARVADYSMHRALAYNPSTPEEALLLCLRGGFVTARDTLKRMVVGHRGMSDKTVSDLAHFRLADIWNCGPAAGDVERRRVASKFRVGPEAVDLLCQDRWWEIDPESEQARLMRLLYPADGEAVSA